LSFFQTLEQHADPFVGWIRKDFEEKRDALMGVVENSTVLALSSTVAFADEQKASDVMGR
jgi:hypothetical protein